MPEAKPAATKPASVKPTAGKPEAEGAAPVTPKKSSKKLLIISVAAAIVLIGGGAGAYFAFFNNGDVADAPDGKKDGKKDAKGKKVAPAKHEVKLPAQFVPLDPPFVVNFEPGASARFLQITVQLMTRDMEMVEFLKQNTPIIRNDLLLLFGNKRVEEVSTNEGKEALRTAALAAVRKIVADEGHEPKSVESVYFTSFVMQ
jgi:flagellar FliL protein